MVGSKGLLDALMAQAQKQLGITDDMQKAIDSIFEKTFAEVNAILSDKGDKKSADEPAKKVEPKPMKTDSRSLDDIVNEIINATTGESSETCSCGCCNKGCCQSDDGTDKPLRTWMIAPLIAATAGAYDVPSDAKLANIIVYIKTTDEEIDKTDVSISWFTPGNRPHGLNDTFTESDITNIAR